ncbi:RNA recognition motif protein [Ceratobasidium sp. AG-Ba]|nr:RNA recognition motif protein [Ceratobasidium sp. AG-Ba]
MRSSNQVQAHPWLFHGLLRPPPRHLLLHQPNANMKDRSKEKRAKKPKKAIQPADEPSDEDNDPSLEDSYRQPRPTAAKPPSKPVQESQSGSGSDSDSDAPPPVYESLLPQNERTSRKQKYVPEGETPEQRDARTIYIGNLPASAANNSARKALHKHILNHLASAHPDLPKPKIESSRFRSIAFKTPTSKLPSDALSTSKPAKPSTNEHQRQRTAEWRAAQDAEDGKPHKTFQTPAQKKKTAFITGALHDSTSSSASAYVVFAHPPPVERQEPAWDPIEVAALAVQACNGTVFMDRTLRVDRADPRTMVFVGNLDFEVHEDAVRDLFEKLVEKERGATAATGNEDDEASDEEGEDSEDSDNEEEDDAESDKDEAETEPSGSFKPEPSALVKSATLHRWVKSVRIIRDKDTQLGKGFAYVQFYDRASADEILAIEAGTIKLAKRKLRIQRCKTLPGATLPRPKTKERPATVRPPKSSILSSRRSSVPTVPGADPALGDRIRSLSKEERKAVKSSDADRVARRLAKKKARVEMERGVRKAGGRKQNPLGGRNVGKSKAAKGGKGKRERSDKATLRKNVKK